MENSERNEKWCGPCLLLSDWRVLKDWKNTPKYLSPLGRASPCAGVTSHTALIMNNVVRLMNGHSMFDMLPWRLSRLLDTSFHFIEKNRQTMAVNRRSTQKQNRSGLRWRSIYKILLQSSVFILLHHSTSTLTENLLQAELQLLKKNSFISHNPFAQSSVIGMHIITFLAFSTGLAISYVAAAPALIPNTFYPNGVVVKYYPNGLPAGLYPGTELTSRATNLAKRDPQTTIDAPGVAAGDLPQVEVTACSDENFSGRCLVIRSFPGQCGRLLVFFTWGKGDGWMPGTKRGACLVGWLVEHDNDI